MTDHEDDVLPPWTREELALLRSAETDAPSARSLPAALAAVGVGGAIAASSAGAAAAAAASSPASAVGGASAASGVAGASAASGVAGASAASGAASASIAAAKWSASIALGKWIAVAAVGSVVVTGGIVLSKRLPANDRAVPQLNQAARTPQPAALPRVAAPSPTPTAVPADQPTAVPAAEPARAPTHPTRQPSASSTAAREPPAQPDIRREIASLDSARASLRNGHAREALAALDRYDSSFGPNAALQLEASTLRIEALAQTGDRARAEALAHTFLAAHPNTPYAARIRALLSPGADNRPVIR